MHEVRIKVVSQLLLGCGPLPTASLTVTGQYSRVLVRWAGAVSHSSLPGAQWGGRSPLRISGAGPWTGGETLSSGAFIYLHNDLTYSILICFFFLHVSCSHFLCIWFFFLFYLFGLLIIYMLKSFQIAMTFLPEGKLGLSCTLLMVPSFLYSLTCCSPSLFPSLMSFYNLYTPINSFGQYRSHREVMYHFSSEWL